MDFFGIGPLEIILILFIGLLVFGPGKLPQIGRDLGRAVRSFRKAATDVTTEMKKEMKDLEDEQQGIVTNAQEDNRMPVENGTAQGLTGGGRPS